MKLTTAELQFLGVLDRVVGNAVPMEWLKPAKRAMVKRMRQKGLLSKRDSYYARATALGMKTLRRGDRVSTTGDQP